MKRATAAWVFLLLVSATPSSARAERFFLPLEREGGWLDSDKTLHFATSFVVAASWRVEGEREGTVAGLTIGLGVAKEVYDATFRPSRDGRGASRKDLVVDVLGTAAGILFIRAIDR